MRTPPLKDHSCKVYVCFNTDFFVSHFGKCKQVRRTIKLNFKITLNNMDRRNVCTCTGEKDLHFGRK